jgi:hypothetical protein
MANQNIIEKNIFNGMMLENMTLTYVTSTYIEINNKHESDILDIKKRNDISGRLKVELINNIKLNIEANKAALKKYKSAMQLSKLMVKHNPNNDMKQFIELMQYFYADMTKLMFDKISDYREIRKENIIPALAQKVDAFESGCVKIGDEFYKITI